MTQCTRPKADHVKETEPGGFPDTSQGNVAGGLYGLILLVIGKHAAQHEQELVYKKRAMLLARLFSFPSHTSPFNKFNFHPLEAEIPSIPKIPIFPQ